MEQLIGVPVGLLATLTMDLGSFAALKAGAPKPPHLPYIGRWFMYLARGRISHRTIVEAPPLAGEAVAFPVGHYLIGAFLGVAFMLLLAEWPAHTWVLGLAFGAFTCVLPWLLMFPSMGFGFFGLKGPGGSRLVLMPVVGHIVFGVGLAHYGPLCSRAHRGDRRTTTTPSRHQGCSRCVRATPGAGARTTVSAGAIRCESETALGS